MTTFDSRIPPVPAVRPDGSPDVIERRHGTGTIAIDGTLVAVVPAEPTQRQHMAGYQRIVDEQYGDDFADSSLTSEAWDALISYRAMLAAADPSLTGAVVEMHAALAKIAAALDTGMASSVIRAAGDARAILDRVKVSDAAETHPASTASTGWIVEAPAEIDINDYEFL